MSNPINETIVASIIDDLTGGATLSLDDACFRFSRAVQSLRITAARPGTVISAEQREALDSAIRAAQPIIVGEPANLDLRIMVCALHVVTAEWANTDREDAAAPDNTVEAFLLARMLSNNLDNVVLRNIIQSKRAGMDPAQWHWLGDIVNSLYPLPTLTSPDPMPLDPRTLH